MVDGQDKSGAGEPLPQGSFANGQGGQIQGATGTPTPSAEPLPPGGFANTSQPNQQSNQSNQSQQQTKDEPSFLSRVYETTGAKGMVDLGKAYIERPIDLYHEAIDALHKGDYKTASEKASKITSYAYGGIIDKENPLYKAASEIIMQPVREGAAAVKEGYKGVKAGLHGNFDEANAHMLSSAQHQIGAVPLVGGWAQDVGQKVNEDIGTYNKDGLINTGERKINAGALAGDILGTGTSLLLPKVTKGISNVLSRGGEAAETVGKLSKAAEVAPKESSLANTLGDQIRAARETVDNLHEQVGTTADAQQVASTENAANRLAVEKDAAETQKNAASSRGDDNVQQMKNEADEKLANDSVASTQTADQTRTQAHGELLETLKGVAGEEPPEPQALSKLVNEGINKAEAESHTRFENGINGEKELNGEGEDGIVTRLKGQSMPFTESPLSEKAGELLNKPVPGEHNGMSSVNQLSGDMLKPGVKKLLEEFSDGARVVGEGEDATSVPFDKLTAKDLVTFRQRIRKAAAGFQMGDPNSRALRGLLPAIDDTLAKLAESSGDESIVKDYQDLRTQYGKSRQLLDSSTAEKLNLTNPDTAMDDVSKFLTSGGNALAKLKTMRSILGDGTMQDIARSKAGQWLKMADEGGGAKFTKEWNKLSPEVKTSFFGLDTAQKLDSAATKFQSSMEAADVRQATADATSKDTAKSSKAVADNLAEAHKAATKQQWEQAKDAAQQKYGDAVQLAKDTRDRVMQGADKAHDANLESFKGGFMSNLAEGRINDALFKGQVDVQDIAKVRQAIGSAKWGKIADGIFQRWIADAAPNGRFDPQALLDQWKNVTPEVRDALFKDVRKPGAMGIKQFEDQMKAVTSASDVKRVVRGGVGLSTLAASAGAGYEVGSFLQGAMGQLIGMFGGMTASTPLLKQFVEYVANHPTTWKTLSNVDKVGKAGAAAGKTAPVVGAVGSTLNRQKVFAGATSLAR